MDPILIGGKMTSKLICKIEKEQEVLEEKAVATALVALGINPTQRRQIMEDYAWLQNMKKIHQQCASARTTKCEEAAFKRYQSALDLGIQQLGAPLKVADWKRAGEAMNRVFCRAAKDRVRAG